MTGSATLTAVASMNAIADPRIAATSTAVFDTRTVSRAAPAWTCRSAGMSHGVREPHPAVTAKKTAKKPRAATPPDRIPKVVANATLRDHLAIITRAVMQAGMSWAFIDARWESYVTAFDGFDVAAVASYGEFETDRLMHADGVIHSRSKIEGTIANARTLLALEREFGSIAAYQASFADYDAARKDARKRFAFMGDLNTYYWRFRTGATVPDLEEWMQAQDRDHPRMREMVQRRQGAPKP